MQNNLVGFLRIFEGCRNFDVKYLVDAFSSTVYGNNEEQPLSLRDNVDYPISLYAGSKRSNGPKAFSYSHLLEPSITGRRYFTVYGPLG